MSAALETYLEAVSKRKSIDRSTPSPKINYAIVAQLEEHDIPLLVKMLRELHGAVLVVSGSVAGVDKDAAITTLELVSQLAAGGNSKRWGEYVRPDGLSQSH